MNKRLTLLLLILLGAVIFLAHTAQSQIKLVATKIEMNGEVKLAWTKPLSADNTTQYTLYRALLPDTTAIIVTTTSDTAFVDHVPPVLTPLPQAFAYKVVAKTGAVIEVSNIALASVPGVPMIGSFRLEGKIEDGKVKLLWQQPTMGNVSYYLVYRGFLGDNGLMHVKIDSTVNQWSVTAAPMPDVQTTYVFYVKAKLTTGETIISTTLQLTIYPFRNRDDVKFTSVPNPYGQKDVKYQYTAHAVSSDPAAVIWYSGSAYNQMGWTVMEKFAVDSVSGAVDWTPLLKGSYKVTIVARSNKNGVAKQEFIVFVSGGNGIIQGKVTDTVSIPNAAPIPNTIIEVFKTENNNSLSFAYAARTDNNGNYRISRVDPGVYKIKANAPSGKYQSQWYDGQRDVSQANPVTVEDSSKNGPTIVSFKLRGGNINAPRVSVSGTVKDSAGLAINGSDCHVAFVRAEFALNLSGGMGIGIENFRKYFDFNRQGDFRLEGNSEFVFKAKVDSIGRYTVKLPPGGYIALARAKGYAVEFYNEQINILTADVIRVQNDTSGIGFTLSPLPPVVLGAISGKVLDSVNNVIVPSRVIAFRDGWRFNDKHRISRVYVTDTDSTGAYLFNDVLPGMYVVMALPLGNYAPAFYSTDTVNYRWKRATKVEVNETGNSVDNINIYVRLLGPSAAGFTAITGTVNVSGGNGMMNGSSRAGATVYAYRNGEIVGYSFTNPEGRYAITGLAPGQYSVFVDKVGYNESSTSTVSASYDMSGNPLAGSADFSINAVLAVTVNTTVVPADYTLEQNYPNPFNPSTTIRFSLPNAGRATLKIYNVVGQETATLIDGYKDAGQYAVTFDAARYSSGVYFYRLETGSFHQVKKMLLIK
jgi:protocatechuate 3,4-dioxygenase beta subunit